jgi:hypothetical protein
MTKSIPVRQADTEPNQIWQQLDADYQRRALQLLARIALNFLTAYAVSPAMEDLPWLNNEATRSYEPTTSHVPR